MRTPSTRALRLPTLALLASFAAGSHADMLGFRIGAYSWQPDYEGTVRSGGEKVDLQRDLGYSDDDASVIFLALEHPVPVLPNVLLQHTQLDSSASTVLNRSFTFDDVTYSISDSVTTDVDLTHTDLTLYYEILDNWVELDLGLTVRHFSNEVSIRSATAGDSSADLSVTLPMVYAAARFNLPLSGLYIAVDGSGASYSGDRLIDYRALIGYETSIGLGVEVGMRKFDLSYEDDNDEANIKADGVYGQVFYHF
jgi:outer membrane protein